MSEKELRDALLKQNGGAHPGPLDAELSALQRLVDAEKRRMRRLTIWTIIVWCAWVLMIMAGLGAPMLAYQSARSDGPVPPTTQPVETTQPAATSIDQSHRRARQVPLYGVIIGCVVFALVLGLPIAGLVLLIMMILGRRTASTNRIRASVAALEAKLRLLELGKPQSEK